MKLIKPGRLQKGWAKEFHCTGKGNNGGGCDAVLLVERDDLFQTHASYMGRDQDYFVTFRCCECGVLTDIHDTGISAIHLPQYRDWLKQRGLDK